MPVAMIQGDIDSRIEFMGSVFQYVLTHTNLKYINNLSDEFFIRKITRKALTLREVKSSKFELEIVKSVQKVRVDDIKQSMGDIGESYVNRNYHRVFREYRKDLSDYARSMAKNLGVNHMTLLKQVMTKNRFHDKKYFLSICHLKVGTREARHKATRAEMVDVALDKAEKVLTEGPEHCTSCDAKINPSSVKHADCGGIFYWVKRGSSGWMVCSSCKEISRFERTVCSDCKADYGKVDFWNF